MLGFRYCLLLLFLILSCGTEEKDQELYPQDEPRCLNCGMNVSDNDTELPKPQPSVYLSPVELLFYFTDRSEYPFHSQNITVFNSTNGLVIITNAFITDANTIFGENGRNYFILSALSLPYELAPGDFLPMEISFNYSSEQRGAELIIYTTYEPNSKLVAKLSGKVFLFH